MVKRSSLVKLAGKAHGPGDAGGYERKTKPTKIKKKIKIKKQSSSTATSAVMAAAADDMFAMGIDTKLSVRARKKKNRKQKEEAAMVPMPMPVAFEDEKKQSMLDQILAAAKGNNRTSVGVPVDEHRARTEELRRAKVERQALKAERWAAAHQKR